MQGYQKTTAERKFAMKVEEFLRSQHIFYAKNYALSVTQYSKPDYFLCLHGRFIGVEIENYSVMLPDGTPPFIPKNILDAINQSKGGFIKVTPDNFEKFKKTIAYAVKVFSHSKSFDEKIRDSFKKNRQVKRFNKTPKSPTNKVIVEVKKKPRFASLLKKPL